MLSNILRVTNIIHCTNPFIHCALYFSLTSLPFWANILDVSIKDVSGHTVIYSHEVS